MKHRFFDLPRQYRTGGLAQRQTAFAACVDMTNRCNYVAEAIDMGGPIDAPDLMPAGACEGVRWYCLLKKAPELHAADCLRPGVEYHPEVQP